MNTAQHRPTRFESIVAITLVAAPIIILVVIFALQQTDISRFGIRPPITGNARGQSGDGLDELAPRGFKPFGPGEYYDQETLYEKIDGKAPLYTESGFVKLSCQRYVNEKDEDLTFELYLYNMGSAANAFSVYSIQRRAGSTPVDEMRFAYRTENALYLAHGRYYCELVGSSPGAPGLMLDALDSTATALVEKLKDAGPTEIPGLALFPADGLIPDTFILYLNGAFGFDGLTNTFSAKYKNDVDITAFISKQSDEVAAQNLADRYYKFLIDNGGAESTRPDSASKVVDFYGSLEVISSTGPFVFGIHQAADQAAAETILLRIHDKLIKENR